MKHRLRRSKKGFASSITAVVLILVTGFVILAIVSPAMREAIFGIKEVVEYNKPDLKLENNYRFTTKDVGIQSLVDSKCTEVQGEEYTYRCQLGTDIKLRVAIYNDGTKMRTFYGNPKYCMIKDEYSKEIECESNIANTYSSSKDCVIVPGETKECDGGTFNVNTHGTYRIFAGSYCALDSEVGCYNSGISGAIRSDNSDTWITIITTPPGASGTW